VSIREIANNAKQKKNANNELERMGWQAFCHILRKEYCSCLEGLRKATKKDLGQDHQAFVQECLGHS
jgi:integrase